MIQQQSHFIPISATDQLHIRRIWPADPQVTLKEPILMVHGAIENGRIFYSSSGKGVGPYFARQGYDVYVLDLRGRGESKPRLSRKSTYGQFESITEEIPAAIDFIRSLRGETKQHWVSHSWGGVLLASSFARMKKYRQYCRSFIFFATKRSVRAFNLEIAVKIHFFWKFLSRLLISIFGYLPARLLRAGSDDETNLSHLHSKLWVKADSTWADPHDGFNYESAMQAAEVPPVISITGTGDHCLGNPLDVKNFLEEMGVADRATFRIVGKPEYQQDYDHVSIVVHPDAEKDHFPMITQWMENL